MARIGLVNDKRAGTAILWAMCLLPLSMLLAGALDFNDRETASRHLKSATDSAAIAAARYAVEFDASEADIKLAAERNFEENIRNISGASGLVPVIVIDPDNGISVSASYNKPTSMLGLAGISTLKVKAKSVTAFQTGSEIEAVLVVDNSFSMDGAGMAQLRAAANQFLNEVLEDDSGRVKIGVVPFNNYVNIGTDKAGEPWLNLPADYSNTQEMCVIDQTATEAAGCTISPSCTSDYDCSDYVCPTSVNPVTNCTSSTYDFTWYGCVESRPEPYDVSDADYGMHKERARLNYSEWGCRNAILPLTATRSVIDDHLDNLVAEGDTYIAPGLSWGAKVLSSQAPFTEGASETEFAARGGRKILILMSDGENTRSADASGSYAHHWGQDLNDANDRTREACNEIKNDDIEVYTIAFGMSDTETLKILEGCASDIEQFYRADNAGELISAFKDIGKAFRDIALVE
jgi:Mg-chelatase subunit ChlD